MAEYVAIDFETEAIQARPDYPPKPVGVAILWPGKSPVYYAWGHPAENNCTKEQAATRLKEVWTSGLSILGHNLKFDLDVAEVHFGLKIPPWDRIHDSLLELFLTDPHAESLSLKPSSERLLGMPPEERDAVHDWLVEHKVILRSQAPGAFISQAPGNVVAPYACGDVVRTTKLHEKLYPTLDSGMRQAYDRERKLLPILLENEREGVKLDVRRLSREVKIYEKALLKADHWLRKVLASPNLNLDADTEVAAALKSAGVVENFVKTKTGKDSTSKKNLLPGMFKVPEIARVLGYRNRLQTVLANSMRPWLAQAATTGKIYTSWNQVRQEHGRDKMKGTRTGRLSCSRFQNITKDFSDKGDGYEHPLEVVLPELPLVRRYIMPDDGDLFCHRDYNQQEFRILAHYEDGDLLQSYRENPRIDYHALMQERVKNFTGRLYERRPIKIINFAINYGTGLGLLAQMLKTDVAAAKELRTAAKRASPGVVRLEQELKRRGKEGQPIRTWGGRLYNCEPPSYSKKHDRYMTYEYKMLNYLIQGSAADCTKEAILRYHDLKKYGRFVMTVHDELNVSAPKKSARVESEILRQAMESVEFDVAMLTDAKYGTSWGDLE